MFIRAVKMEQAEVAVTLRQALMAILREQVKVVQEEREGTTAPYSAPVQGPAVGLEEGVEELEPVEEVQVGLEEEVPAAAAVMVYLVAPIPVVAAAALILLVPAVEAVPAAQVL